MQSAIAPQSAEGERTNAANTKHGRVKNRPKKPKLCQKEYMMFLK